jgi:DNA-directed RNA polymerase subunit RPC12/RpoP
MRRRGAQHRDRCAFCRYDLNDIDFERTHKCPECGRWIAVRIVPSMPWYMTTTLSLLMPTYMLALFGVLISLDSMIDGPIMPALIPLVIMVVSVTVSIVGVQRLVTKPLNTTGMVLAWIAAINPILLVIGGCILGVVLAML